MTIRIETNKVLTASHQYIVQCGPMAEQMRGMKGFNEIACKFIGDICVARMMNHAATLAVGDTVEITHEEAQLLFPPQEAKGMIPL